MRDREAEQSALLIRCPAAERAVGAWRARLDLAAGVGVPAHVTVTYPFRPAAALGDADHDRLERLFAAMPPFTLVGERTAWFGDEAVYVELTGTERVSTLIDAVALEFPEHPPYGGTIADVIPHVTIGHDHDAPTLQAAAAEVDQRLPFRQEVTAVELWSGPPPTTRHGRWCRVRAYPLGLPPPA
ncbi:MAG: 2'-5' RNA ligase family protein [Ornithinibacter sp.]